MRSTSGGPGRAGRAAKLGLCSILGCRRNIYTVGLCTKHYDQRAIMLRRYQREALLKAKQDEETSQ